jgi:hypothetical protein
MASFPRITNEGIPAQGEPFVFPSYRNIDPPYITTLILLGLMIGLMVWFLSTQVIFSVASSLVLRNSPQENQPHVDPSPSSLVRYSSPYSLARSSSVSYSLSSECSEASYLIDKKNKKRKIKTKKNKQGSKIPTIAKHVGKPPFVINHVGSVDDAKITQTTHKIKYPCRIFKGRNLFKDFLGLSKVIEVWYAHPHHPMLSAS